MNAVQGRRGLFSVRLRCIRQRVARKLGSTHHERRVMALAARLFDLTAPIHGLGERERRLLKIGALLHDVGRCCGARRHHVRGAEIIMRNGKVDLREPERCAAAYLARYHRGRAPEQAYPWDHSALRQEGQRLRILLALLRAADSMDSRRLASPALVMRLRDGSLDVRCHVRGNLRRARAILGRKKGLRLLDETLGLSVEMRICRSTAGPCAVAGH